MTVTPTSPVAEQVVVPAALPSPTASPSPKPAPHRVAPKPPRPHVVDRPLPPAPPQTGCPPTPRRGGGKPRPMAPPAVAETSLPAPLPVKAKATSLTAVRGKGLWVTPFGKTPVDAAALVARARATHVRSIWIRTGGSRQGYYGDRFLGSLVPTAHRAGIQVIAWDFPFLSDPVADAARAQRALAAGVDGFAPDIETAAEGTHLTQRRLRVYLGLVRSY